MKIKENSSTDSKLGEVLKRITKGPADLKEDKNISASETLKDDTVNLSRAKDVAKVLFDSSDAEARKLKVSEIKQQIATLGIDGYLKELSGKPDYYTKVLGSIDSEVSLFQQISGSDE